MAFFQGSALPNVTETQTVQDKLPDWYTNIASGLSGVGQQFLAKTPQQLTAGYDPLQTKGYGQVEEAAGAYKPGLTAAGQTANAAAAGITPERLQQLMNPYTQNVVQELARQSGQNLQRNILPQITGQFVGSGALGSQRYAGALGQALTDTAADLSGQQGKLLASGYNTSLDALLKEQQNQTQAGKLQADIAAQEQGLGLAGAGALRQAGAERQKYEQSVLESPMTTASNVASLLRGYTLPSDKTQTIVKPGQQGQYGLSDFQKIGNLAMLLGGVNTSSQLAGLTSQQFQNLKNLGSSGLSYLSSYFNPTVNPSGGYTNVLSNQIGSSVVNNDPNAIDNWDLNTSTGGFSNAGWGSYGAGDTVGP
jgi:hypothetical protein